MSRICRIHLQYIVRMQRMSSIYVVCFHLFSHSSNETFLYNDHNKRVKLSGFRSQIRKALGCQFVVFGNFEHFRVNIVSNLHVLEGYCSRYGREDGNVETDGESGRHSKSAEFAQFVHMFERRHNFEHVEQRAHVQREFGALQI